MLHNDSGLNSLPSHQHEAGTSLSNQGSLTEAAEQCTPTRLLGQMQVHQILTEVRNKFSLLQKATSIVLH